MIKFEDDKAEEAKAETSFMAGFHHGAKDAREHPTGHRDPWEGGYGSRAAIAFRNWWAGILPRKKA